MTSQVPLLAPPLAPERLSSACESPLDAAETPMPPENTPEQPVTVIRPPAAGSWSISRSCGATAS